MEEIIRVVTEYGEELYRGETAGDCQRWCKKNNITGSNGEYIAFGTYKNGYFDIEDYTEIDMNF